MRADVASDGSPADGSARHTSLSGDGSRVAFTSAATNLVADDTNGVADVFLHSFDDDSTIRVSVASDGSEGDGPSGSHSIIGKPIAISADGHYVAFESDATNLVADDTNGVTDVFVRDLDAGVTARVSVATDGTQADGVNRSVSISNNGRYVGFISHGTSLMVDAPTSGMYVHDRMTGETTLASIAHDGTPVSADSLASLSGDGRHVAFESSEPGIVAGDMNDDYDVFERNLVSGTTTRVSVTPSGAPLVGGSPDEYSPDGPAISFNGRFVAFTTIATNLPPPNDPVVEPHVLVHDRRKGTTVQADVASNGWISGSTAGIPVMSDDGRYVGLRGNLSLAPCGGNFESFYVRDLVARTTVRVSTHANGLAAPTSGGSSVVPTMDLSADGHIASFASDLPLAPDDADAITNVYVDDVTSPVGAPDLAIARASGPLAGVNLCSPSPTTQTRAMNVPPGTRVAFTLRVRNWSDSPDVLILHGDGGHPGFAVKYFQGTTDVTAAVRAGTRRTRLLEPGEFVTYRLTVRVFAGAAPGDVLVVIVRGSSRNQPAVKDVVRARVTVSS